ncbi:unnamed protein product [Rodentolepis nana]|uniref:polynucleotide adenylyltransferase n=1 Tax=Rodentolepis nana TaxID=102285 RepID=A0A0R3TBP8_RODNA|nr:unnamed protein product [Rodentolepis nana]
MTAIADSKGESTDYASPSLERTLESMIDFQVSRSRQHLKLLKSVAEAWIQSEAARKVQVTYDEPYRVKIIPFGAYCQGINTKDDDNGVLLVAPKWISQKSFTLLFAEMLRFKEPVEYVLCSKRRNLIRTKIAGIKFDIFLGKLPMNNVPSNFKISESIDASLFIELINEKRIFGMINASSMLTMVYSKKVFQTALKTIKMWAKECGIFSNVLRYLNNFNLTIMTCRICQLFPLEPVEKIVYHFFRIYSQWNWREPIIMNSSVLLQTSKFPHRYHEEVPSKVNVYIRFGHKINLLCRMISDYGYKRVLDIIKRGYPWSYLFERKTFFHTYPYYFTITFKCPNEQTFDMWSSVFKTYVRDRVALYEQKDGVEFVHVNCIAFDEALEEDSQSCTKKWFIGIKFCGYPNYFDDVVDEIIHDCEVSVRSFKRLVIACYFSLK